MNIDLITAASEAIGAIAVVISLVYVGVQIRQNTVTQNAQMHQQLVEAQNETNRSIIDNSEMSELMGRANEDFEALTPGDVSRLIFFYFNVFNLWQIAFANTKRGLLEQYLLAEWDRGYRLVFASNPSGSHIWALTRHVYESSFREHIDQIIRSVEHNAA